ncbi:MAG: hypothetical protein BGO45_13035 [Microbacterium sp. 71-36]|uniref:proton-conducting transporter transmembrane domain-containing protein n=1 Tax=unclassified Microbacterium TaxID=2609290 RepID=UPI00092A39ED|nr:MULTISPECIES: proton-conducting transporter membrane subunit [unclassified Microbacterium]MBN9211756.1 hypothetical protein [Microbacterium sp.]OJV77666.1 MAG: hypothetical protein BGO45_13035 [Microbacterium sp. 71-36]
MSTFSLLTVVALLIAAVAALVSRAGSRHTDGFAAVWPTGAATILAAAGLTVTIAARLDPAGAVVTVLVVALTLVVQVFADRHLRGDPRARAFFALSAVVAAGSTVAVSAESVLLLAAGWSTATLAMVALIGTGGRGPQTRAAVRRAAVALAVGDLALWAAVAVVLSTTGEAGFGNLAALTGVPAVTVGVLVAVAAIARAGSFPLHRWLAATAATTTPASALLHAGFVNAGAILLLRFAEVPSGAGPWIVAAAGAVTMLCASVAMLTRPDVKGRLVQSTAAQMGFMLLACGLGAYGVALVHVLGHALFKASLFLGAGSAVERAVAARSRTAAPGSRLGSVVGAGAVLVAGAVALVAGGLLTHTAAVLLLFVLATAGVAGGRIGAGRGPVGIRALLVASVAAAIVAYVLLVVPAAEALAHTVPVSAVPPLFAVAVFLVAGLLAALTRTRGRAADRLFASAFAWGRSPLPSPRPAVTTLSPTAARGPLEYGRTS